MAIRSKWRLLGPDPKFITLLLKAASFFLGWTEGNCMVQFPVKCKVSINRPFWRFSRIKLHQPAWLMANLKVSEKEHLTVIWQVVQKIKWLTAASLCWKVALCSVRESWFLWGAIPQPTGEFHTAHLLQESHLWKQQPVQVLSPRRERLTKQENVCPFCQKDVWNILTELRSAQGSYIQLLQI